MALSRRTSRPRFALLLLVLASVTVITLSYRGRSSGWLGGVRGVASDVFSPIQSAAGTVFDPVGSFFEGAASYGSLKSKNAKLRNQLAALKDSNASAIVARDQLGALAKLDNLSFAPNLSHVVTQVVASAASNFQDTIQLNKGSGAGIRDGMPAVSGTALVGTVVQVFSNRSTVQLLTSQASNVGVSYATPGQPLGQALATGQGAGSPLSVSLVRPGTPLYKGELMETSGVAGDIYPIGIPVGTVAGASLAPGAQQETVTLKPVVNPTQLQFVAILLYKPSPVIP